MFSFSLVSFQKKFTPTRVRETALTETTPIVVARAVWQVDCPELIRAAQRISSSSLRRFPGMSCLSTRSLGYGGKERFQLLLHDLRHPGDLLALVLGEQGGKAVVGHE